MCYQNFEPLRSCDVTKTTHFSRPHTGTVATNGLSWNFKIEFFLKFDVFQRKTAPEISFEQVFRKKVDFGMLINPLRSKRFWKIVKKFKLKLDFQNAVESVKKQLENSNLNQNVGNFILYKKAWASIIKILNRYEAVMSQRQHTFSVPTRGQWPLMG